MKQVLKESIDLTFENDAQRTSHSDYYLPNVKLKDYNVMINGEKFFDQAVKDHEITYADITKILQVNTMITQQAVC